MTIDERKAFLIKFLKDNNCLDSYTYNLALDTEYKLYTFDAAITRLVDRASYTDTFTGAFLWHRTTEGSTYWKRISLKWKWLFDD